MNTNWDARASLLGRETFEAGELWRRFPPVIHHAGKRIVLEIASAGRRPTGGLVASRFGAIGVPRVMPESATTVTEVADVYRYGETPPGTTAWHVNFADPDLFFLYGGAAFAQDEIQVAEHPLLGSLRETLLREAHAGLAPRTRDGTRPTPVLVRDVERWCAIDTAPALAMPHGIYGRWFHRATKEALRQAVTALEPPSRTNLIAMSAPPGGSGAYSRDEVETILTTAFTGFAGARLESAEWGARLVVHTGHWGTGAFGGDRVLMALLQILAARLAGVDELVYYTVDAAGAEPVREAERIVARVAPAGASVTAILEGVVALGRRWETSDGN